MKDYQVVQTTGNPHVPDTTIYDGTKEECEIYCKDRKGYMYSEQRNGWHNVSSGFTLKIEKC